MFRQLILVVLASVIPMVIAAAGPVEVRTVNKIVSDYPAVEDLSTPETAYCAVNRIIATGEEPGWRRVSVSKLRKRMPAVDAPRREVSPERAARFTGAKILEVRIFRGKYCEVIAQFPGEKAEFDLRSLQLVNGQWLNEGESTFDSLEAARDKSAQMFTMRVEKPERANVADREAYLRPYVKWLRERGRDPHAFVMEALAKYPLTVIGEVHHRPVYWAFNKGLVEDPDFAKRVGVVYLELPCHDQALVDQFLANPALDRAPVIDMLRDMMQVGWPDQPMLELFEAVWKANQGLPSEHRVRIVLTDMARPWKDISERADWRKYDVDRDKFMADSVLRDMAAHENDPRHALFIVGVGHTVCNMGYVGGVPLRTAGWHLREQLGGKNVFTISQHMPVQSNMGEVDGRIALGLFDSAFAALDYKPIVFPLKHSPFGKNFYDAQSDLGAQGTYAGGFDAYLFLCKLEDEVFAPLIKGFYDEAFVKECDRRQRIMTGKGLVESGTLKELDPQVMVDYVSTEWGKPRRHWLAGLGPIDAWHYGSGWEKEVKRQKALEAAAHPEIIKAAATGLFDGIRNADYGSYTNNEGLGTLPLQVYKWYDVWMAWVCYNFKDNPITSVELGDVTPDKYLTENRLAIPYKLTRKDGSLLQGTAKFFYMPREQDWCGSGLDWHLEYPEKVPPEIKAELQRPASGG